MKDKDFAIVDEWPGEVSTWIEESYERREIDAESAEAYEQEGYNVTCGEGIAANNIQFDFYMATKTTPGHSIELNMVDEWEEGLGRSARWARRLANKYLKRGFAVRAREISEDGPERMPRKRMAYRAYGLGGKLQPGFIVRIFSLHKRRK